LGNRSILADPRPAENKDRINAMVKRREAYRPFAPSVLEERLREYFGVPGDLQSAPFMNVVLPVLEDKRALLGAVTHVDGTARVQSVARTTNERYWRLIHEFGQLSGVYVLLNTSFNNDAEPIVDSVDDAVVCFLTTNIDYLIVNDYVVSRKHARLRPQDLAGLCVTVRPSHKLVMQKWADGGGTGALRDRFEIQSHASLYFGQPFAEISPLMFRLLSAPEPRALGAAWDALALDAPARVKLVEELYDLWQRRLVVVAPRGTGL
jgi:carbamoyltransferase